MRSSYCLLTKMQHRRRLQYCSLYAARSVAATSLVFSAILLPSVHTQDTSRLTTSTTMTSSHVSSHDSITSSSVTTTIAPASSSNSTTSSPTSRTTNITPELFPGAGSLDSNSVHKENVFNYYFLFLTLFGVVVAVCLWWIHRRRKRRKEQMRLSGQDALARDLDGWVNTRRWMHGAWRHNQTTAFVRREEGLNEHGEPPPPYQPKGDVTVAHSGAGAGSELQDPESGLAIPLRTLSRDQNDRALQPPGYEAVNSVTTSDARPETAATRGSRPDTGASPTNTSTQDLIRNQSN